VLTEEILEESSVAQVGNLFDETSLLIARANEMNRQMAPNSGIAGRRYDNSYFV